MKRSTRRAPFGEFVKTARPLVVEGYNYDFVHFPVDVPGFVRHIRETGANLVRLGTLMGTRAAYPSRYVPTYPGIEGRDWVREMMEECDAAGIRVINYVATATGWNPKDGAASKAVFAKTGPLAGASRPCLNGGEALDVTIASFVEVVERYHPEALYIDGAVVLPQCRCPRCAKAFREKTGGAIPRSFDLTDWWMGSYISWLVAQRAAIWGKIIGACRRVAPDLYVIVNMGDWKNTLLQPRGEEERRMVCAGVGGFHYENRSPASSSYALEAAKFSRVIDAPVWVHCLDVHPFTALIRPPEREVVLKGAKILSAGGAPEAYCHGSTICQEGSTAGVRAVFEFMAKNEAALGERRVGGDSALLYSATSAMRQFQLAPPAPRQHLLADPHYDGMFRALTRVGIPFAVVDEKDLARELARGRFRTLYLASTFRLSDAACRTIRAFVRRGGNLVASFESTLGRSPFEARRDFALADVFGARYLKTEKLDGAYYLRLKGQLRPTEGFPSLVMVPGDAAAVRATTGSVVAGLHWFGPAKGQTMSLDGLEMKPARGIILNRYGKGRAVYVPFALELTEDKPAELSWWYTDDRHALNLLTRVLGGIDRLLNPRPGIRLVDENLKAEVGLLETGDGTVAIVYENTTLTGEMLCGRSDRRKVFLRLPRGKWSRARSMRSGKSLPIRRAADGSHDDVVLDRIDLFEAVRLFR